MDYTKKENWTVRMLEQALVCHTVLQPNERGDFERLWKAKLECEKVIGGVMLPRCRHGFLLNRYGCAECDKEDYEEAMYMDLSENQK